VNQKKIVNNSIKLMGMTLLSRILGLVRESTKAAFLGTSHNSDAFGVAFMIPNLLRRLFAEGTISVAFVPTFKEYLSKDNKSETKAFLNSFFTVLLFLVTMTVLLGYAFTPLVVSFFGTAHSETIILTRIMFPYLAFISLAALFQGVLNSEGIFSPSGFVPVLFNLCVISFTWILSPLLQNPARAMAWGVLAGGMVQAGFQLPYVLRIKHSFHFMSLKKAWRHPGTRLVLKLVGPTILGMAAYQFYDLFATLLAARSGTGVLSSLQFSLRLQELVLGIFAVSISTVLLPELSAGAAEKNWEKYNRQLGYGINLIILICLPVSYFFLTFGETVIRIIYQYRSFDEQSVIMTLNAFRFHAPGIIFIALNRILNPSFYARKNTKAPTAAGVFSLFCGLILAAFLAGTYKEAGIALASSIAAFLNMVILLVLVSRTPEINLSLVKIIMYFMKLLVFSVAAGWVSVRAFCFMQSLFPANSTKVVNLILPFFTSSLVYSLVGIGLLIISGDHIIKQIKRNRKLT